MLCSSVPEDPAVTDTRDRSERKSVWTRSEKIIALILVILLSTAAAAYVGYYSTRSPPVHISPVCSNGGINYPSCNTCPRGQTLANNHCTSPVIHCNNGATDPGTCMTCPAGQSLVSGSCINKCTNGASNPHDCNNNSCPNGATNNPTCTIFNTTTNLSCNPSSVKANDTHTTCTATVTDSTLPTGTVVISCLQENSDPCIIDPSNCTLDRVSGTMSSCQIRLGYSGPATTSIIVNANYTGDNTHQSTIGRYNLTITSPPTIVTVGGSVTAIDFSRPDQIQFQNTKTNVTYNAPVTSGSYSILLPNFESYNVTVHYNGLFGPGTCKAGTFNLRSSTDTLTRDFTC